LVWSPPPESNRRPHPYHGSAAKRRAKRRPRRSQRTVDAVVMGSVVAPTSPLFRLSSAELPVPTQAPPWGNPPGVWPPPLAAPQGRRRSVRPPAPRRSARRWAARRPTAHQAALPPRRWRHRRPPPADRAAPAGPPAKGLHHDRDELVGHRTTPCDPTEASRQAEGLRLADLDGKVPVPATSSSTTYWNNSSSAAPSPTTLVIRIST
jgi:hypothetical protein